MVEPIAVGPVHSVGETSIAADEADYEAVAASQLPIESVVGAEEIVAAASDTIGEGAGPNAPEEDPVAEAPGAMSGSGAPTDDLSNSAISKTTGPIVGLGQPAGSLDSAAEIITPIAGTTEATVGPAAGVVEALDAAVVPVAGPAAEVIGPTVGAVAPTFEPVSGPATVIIDWAAEALGTVSPGAEPIADAIETTIGPAPEPIRQAIESVAGSDGSVVEPNVWFADPIPNLVEPVAAVAAPVAELARPIIEPATAMVGISAEPIGPIIEPVASLADPPAPSVGLVFGDISTAADPAGWIIGPMTRPPAPGFGFIINPTGRQDRPDAPLLVPIAPVVGPLAPPPSSVAPTAPATLPSRPTVEVGGADAEPIGPSAGAGVGRLGSRADAPLWLLSPSDPESLGRLLQQLLGRDIGSTDRALQADGGARTTGPISGGLSASMPVVPVPDRIGPNADSGEGGLEGLGPQSAPLQGGARPFDLGSLDRALGQLLDWLDDLGETLAGWATHGELLAWIMAVALVSAACEITRRDLRRPRLGTGLDGLLPLGPEAP